MAAEAGQLQLNAFEPIIAHSLLQSLAWLGGGCRTLRINCVDGITANEGRLAQMVGSSVGVITALTPYIGYAAAATLAKQALAGQRDVADLVVESGLLTREEVTNLLALERISGQPLETAPIPVLPRVQPMMPPPANR
jgi:aspartate ammonia-lyase